MPLPPLPPLIDRDFDYGGSTQPPFPVTRLKTDLDALFGWTNTTRAWMEGVNATALGLTADAAASAAQAAASQAAAAASQTAAAASATAAATSASNAAATLAGAVLRAGDTMTGALSLVAPTADAHGARRRDLADEYLRTSAAISGTPTWIEFELDAGFEAFEFDFSRIGPSANALFLAQLSTNGGSSWLTGAADYVWGHFGTASSTPAGSSIIALTFTMSTAASIPPAGRLRLDMANGTSQHRFMCDFVGLDSSSLTVSARLFGWSATATRANRIRFGWNGTTFANRGVIIQRGIRA